MLLRHWKNYVTVYKYAYLYVLGLVMAHYYFGTFHSVLRIASNRNLHLGVKHVLCLDKTLLVGENHVLCQNKAHVLTNFTITMAVSISLLFCWKAQHDLCKIRT